MGLYRYSARYVSVLGGWWRSRRDFLRTRWWWCSLYNRVLVKFPHARLPWRGKVCRVATVRDVRPFHLRLGSSDWYVLSEIIFSGEYDRLSFANPDNIALILDLGANIGMSCRWWKMKFPSAKVLAVEPDEGNLRILRLNLETLEPHANVRIFPCCVGGTPRTVHLSEAHPGREWSIAMKDLSSGEEARTAVDARTIAQILSDEGGDRTIDILKCDIEGAEQEVFANCDDWIQRVRLLLIEIHPPYSADLLLSDLAKAGAQMSVFHRVNKGRCSLLFLRAMHLDPLCQRRGSIQLGEERLVTKKRA